MELDAVLAGYGHPWLATLVAALLMVLVVVRLVFARAVTALRRLARTQVMCSILLDRTLRPALRLSGMAGSRCCRWSTPANARCRCAFC